MFANFRKYLQHFRKMFIDSKMFTDSINVHTCQRMFFKTNKKVHQFKKDLPIQKIVHEFQNNVDRFKKCL